MAIRTPEFSGQLSGIFAGETVLALHLGLRSKKVLIYWFLGFNPEFGSMSPGIILLLRLIEQAAKDGLEQIDLGAGKERYKQQLRTSTVQLLAGSVECPSILSNYRALKRTLMPDGANPKSQ